MSPSLAIFFEKFGSFVEKYILDGELDKIYDKNNSSKNVIPFGKVIN